MISKTAIIHPNVKIGINCIIEDFVIIGAPSAGKIAGEIETVIGDNAVIRSHTVIYAGNHIGNSFQTGNKANIRELNQIGHDVSIGTLTVIEHHIKIGNGVRIHSQAFIPEFTILEENTWVGPNVVMTNAKYPCQPETKKTLKGPIVCCNAKIGANATILPGIIIGENSLVGAGSVVTRDVRPKVIVVGNPASIVRVILESSV